MDDRHFGLKQNFLEEALVGVSEWDQTGRRRQSPTPERHS
jgi:hypothetical protein